LALDDVGGILKSQTKKGIVDGFPVGVFVGSVGGVFVPLIPLGGGGALDLALLLEIVVIKW